MTDEPGASPDLHTLLVHHLPGLMAYVRLRAGPLVRGRESLSDLVQSVALEVLRDAPAFEFRGETRFRHWLFTQALHKIQNKHRHYLAGKRDARREVAPPEPSTDGDDARLGDAYATLCTPSRVSMGKERLRALEAAFATLPDDQQQAVLLRRMVGLDYAEIAAQLGRSEGAVRNLVYRGVARLAVALEDANSTPPPA